MHLWKQAKMSKRRLDLTAVPTGAATIVIDHDNTLPPPGPDGRREIMAAGFAVAMISEPKSNLRIR
jgi:hypothetical protein